MEEASAEEVHAVFAVNVEGLLNVTRAVLPAMRARKSGRILNMSSVGGFRAGPGWGVYSGTKFAVEGLSEAMRAELLPLGIHVTLIEPGTFRTDFLDASSLGRAKQVIDDCKETAGLFRNWTDNANHAQLGDPVRGAAAIVEIATTAEPPVRLQLGTDCLMQVENKLANVAKELAAWRKLSESTDYVDSPAAKTA